MTFSDTLPMVWPLTFLLLALVVLRKIEADLRPVFSNVVAGVAKNAQSNATAYALGMGLACLASLQSLVEVATQFGWVGVAAFAKVIGPGLGTLVAFANRNGASNSTPPSTVPPFSPKP